MFPSYLQTVRRIILTDNREAAIVCVRPASQSLGLASMRIAAMRCGRIVDKSQNPKRIVVIKAVSHQHTYYVTSSYVSEMSAGDSLIESVC
jgi:hypothetical protein